MSTLTLHTPYGERIGAPLDVFGDAERIAREAAERHPGDVVIVWDADGLPSHSWSFPRPKREEVEA